MTPELKMGRGESHFNVSLIVRDGVTRQCPQTTTFEERGKAKRIRTEVLLLTSLTVPSKQIYVHCCFTSTETITTVRDGEPRTSNSTVTQLLNSENKPFKFDLVLCRQRP